MSDVRPPGGPSVPAPDEREVPDPGRRYDAMQIFQSLIEIQRDIASLSTKIERLVADVNKIDGKISGIESSLTLAKGFGIAVIILIPICAAIIWWLIGAQLENLRDEFLGGAKPPLTHHITPMPPGPSSTAPTRQ